MLENMTNTDAMHSLSWLDLLSR